MATGYLIPRADLFGVPECSGVQISPDGAWLGWIAPMNGVPNIWIAPREAADAARALTRDRHRGVHGFQWSADSLHLLYAQDRDGDEIFHVHAVAVAGGEPRDLTPVPSARGFVVAVSARRPGELVVALNDRDPAWPDLWIVEVSSATRRLLCRNDRIGTFVLDDDFVVRAGWREKPDGGAVLLRREHPGAEAGGGAEGMWREWLRFSPEDARTSAPLGVDAAARTLYLRDSRGRDTAALVALDLATGREELLAADARADLGGTLPDRHSHRPLACFFTVARREVRVLDPAVQPDLDRLAAAGLGDWAITARSLDDRWWTIAAGSDVRPGTFWLYDRQGGSVTLLREGRPALARRTLAPMRALVIPARDGLPLVCYLTRPAGAEAPGPLVLLVHGGPWIRDGFGYHAEHQWLADRGYSVLSVNFRGSTGFGKAFLHAGDGEWGRRMDDDLADAVAWVVAEGVADPARLAIMGASYGGYAVLSALTREPARYACGVDIVGPSNLETLIAATPPHWESQRAMLHRAVGDPTTEYGRAILRDRSPLHRAERVTAPLLVGQGTNDPRVPQAESDRMVAAIRGHGGRVDYALFPDEGHAFVRPANVAAFRILTEWFLARHLGGAFQAAGPGEAAGTTAAIDGDVPLSIFSTSSERPIS